MNNNRSGTTSNRFSYLSEFFSDKKSMTMTRETVIGQRANIENEFPELGTSNSNHAPQINYENIIFNLSDDDEYITKEQNLYDGDYLILQWYDVKKMYEDTAPYRVRLDYLTVCEKIKILDICDSDFKEQMNYSNLVEDQIRLKTCLDMCITISALIDIFEKYGLGIDNDISNWTSDVVTNALNIISSKMDSWTEGFYSSHAMSVNLLIRTVRESPLKLRRGVFELEYMIEDIIKKADRNIDCIYNCTLTNLVDGKINVTSLESWTSVFTSQALDSNVPKSIIDKRQANWITESSFNEMFSVKPLGHVGTILICSMNNSHPDIKIKYIVDTEPENKYAYIRLQGHDSSTKYFPTIINKKTQPTESIPQPPYSSEQYLSLETRISIETLFETFVDSDIEKECVNESMYDSFAALIARLIRSQRRYMRHRRCSSNFPEYDEQDDIIDNKEIIDKATTLYNTVISKYVNGYIELQDVSVIECLSLSRFIEWMLCN